jgi:putative ABC transport system permease protein
MEGSTPKEVAMWNTFRIAARNLLRYKRRTLLTVGLIALGTVFVLVFMAVAGSFKNMMIRQMTDSFIGHLQIHKRGYLAAIDNLPLHMNMNAKQMGMVEKVLAETPEIESYSPRIKFGAAFSNFEQTTNIRVNGVIPEKEFATCPLLVSRITEGSRDLSALERGKILVPELLARGLGVKPGDTVVLVATDKDGSVNGKTFLVGGVLESATGPGGRDGYIHMEDARELLRMSDSEVSEVAIRIRDFSMLDRLALELEAKFPSMPNMPGKSMLEVSTWEKLSPFSSIARMIDALAFFIRVILVAIVLVSIMNVMVMAVYERIREIGTMAAMGTLPGKILSLFITEGLLIGVLGGLAGWLLSGIIVVALRLAQIRFSFGRQENLLLVPSWDLLQWCAIFLVVMVVAVLASLQPAWKASRMEPIDALGHV